MIKEAHEMTVDDYLNQVDYATMEEGYVPSQFAIHYVNFIKLVNGAEGESNVTPTVHYKWLDQLANKKKRLANLCSRGFGKALSVHEKVYMANGGVRSIGEVEHGDLIIGEDGKPTMVQSKSKVNYKPMYRIDLVDGRSIKVCEEHINVVIHKRKVRVEGKSTTQYQRRELTTEELLKYVITSPRAKTKKNPRGREHNFWIPNCSPVEYSDKDYTVDPYTLGILLGDGRMQKESGFATLTSHVDDLPHYKSKVPYEFGTEYVDKRNTNVVTVSLLKLGSRLKALGVNVHGDYKFIPQEYLYGSVEQRTAILAGLMDTDGTITKQGCSSFTSNSERLRAGVIQLVRSLGGTATESGLEVNIKINSSIFTLPRKVSRENTKSSARVAIESITSIADEPSQCIYVDNASHTFLTTDYTVTHNTVIFGEYLVLYLAVFGEIPGFGKVDGMIYVSDSMENGAKSLRKNVEFRYHNSEFMKKFVPHAKFTDPMLEFVNADGKQLGVRLFGAKTGLRGTKIYGKRPTLAILDDLVSDSDANSPTVMRTIKDTVYKGVTHALDPTNGKTIFSGTPFNKSDILYEAIESGAWEVNVYPICDNFPCAKEDFVGAWPDRFSYEYVRDQYESAKLTGELASFMQELMLRITNDEDRMIQDSDINWYSRAALLANRASFNFYITTDFATSEKQSADFSVISVWAYNNKGMWFLVDGVCKRQLMDANLNDLFRLAQMYEPQSVGIEVSGQQGGFIPWIQQEMLNRNQWFPLASENNSNKPGVRPVTNKMARFNTVVPWFKKGIMFLPQDGRGKDQLIIQAEDQLCCATKEGFKSKHDDVIDTISMLSVLKPWRPSQEEVMGIRDSSGIWTDPVMYEDDSGDLGNYIV